MGLTEIIILTRGNERLTVDCLGSIAAHTSQDATPFKIAWVDNASNQKSFDAVDSEMTRLALSCRHIMSAENLGFVKGCNIAIDTSEAEFVVLLNNDTRVTGHWLDRLLARLERHNVGVVGSIETDKIRHESYLKMLGIVPPIPAFDGTNEAAVAAFYASKYAGKSVPLCWMGTRRPMVSFFCAAFRRRTFEKIGLLDEAFGIGLGDDDDYCLRLHKAGYLVLAALDVVVYHAHRATFRKEVGNYGAVSERNLGYLRQKHPGVF